MNRDLFIDCIEKFGGKISEEKLNQFENEIPVLNMPKTYTRPAVKSYEGSKVYSSIDSETVNKINNI